MKNFAGDKKEGAWFLQRWEYKLRDFLVPLVPRFIETYHLTLTTILWSCLVLFAGYKAQYNTQWLWLSSLSIFGQYVTDLLDGAVGRARNTGLVKWGYYMDHFLDYVFLSSYIGSFYFLAPEEGYAYVLALLFVGGGFMVHSFLYFSATNEFHISFMGVGPTEMRIFFVIINTALVYIGTEATMGLLKVILALSFAGLLLTVYKSHKILWAHDRSQLSR